jgi:FAE1/Type III polyketide synthase-like protein
VIQSTTSPYIPHFVPQTLCESPPEAAPASQSPLHFVLLRYLHSHLQNKAQRVNPRAPVGTERDEQSRADLRSSLSLSVTFLYLNSASYRFVFTSPLPNPTERERHTHTMSSGTAGERSSSPHRRLPDFLQSVNLKYVKLGYHYLITHLLTLLLLPLIAVVLLEAIQTDPNDIRQLWLHLQFNLVSVVSLSALLVFASTVYLLTRPRSVYLVDYSCYVPPPELKAPFIEFMGHSKVCGFDESALEFQRKILERSGLGEETYVPEAMHAIPPQPSMANARAEAEQVCIWLRESSCASIFS